MLLLHCAIKPLPAVTKHAADCCLAAVAVCSCRPAGVLLTRTGWLRAQAATILL
jgi:hypothetical protein